MAKVYGTNEHDLLGWRGLFDRDGATDGDDTIFGMGGDDWIYGRDGNDFCRAARAPTSSSVATISTPRFTATPWWA